MTPRPISPRISGALEKAKEDVMEAKMLPEHRQKAPKAARTYSQARGE